MAVLADTTPTLSIPNQQIAHLSPTLDRFDRTTLGNNPLAMHLIILLECQCCSDSVNHAHFRHKVKATFYAESYAEISCFIFVEDLLDQGFRLWPHAYPAMRGDAMLKINPRGNILRCKWERPVPHRPLYTILPQPAWRFVFPDVSQMMDIRVVLPFGLVQRSFISTPCSKEHPLK